jgi:hypothetical protein
MIMNEPVEIENMRVLFHHHLCLIQKLLVIQSKCKRMIDYYEFIGDLIKVFRIYISIHSRRKNLDGNSTSKM